MDRRRVWLLLPLWLVYWADVSLTLHNQPQSYWDGEYHAVHEANPLAFAVLLRGPACFLALATVWALLLAGVVIIWRHPISTAVAIINTVTHAVGAYSWLVLIEPWGWLYAAGFLVVVAETASWCWRRSGVFRRA